MEQSKKISSMIDALFAAGAHFAFPRSRRHPSAKPFIFGAKNRVEIFDLEETAKKLDAAKAFVSSVATAGGVMLMVGGKSESRAAIQKHATAIDMPYVAGRWVGGTLTNFLEIRRRIDKLERMLTEKEKGITLKYTKKERLLMDREMAHLEMLFGGIRSLKELPKVLFVVDAKREHTAVTEAKKMGVKVVALCGSDTDLSMVDYAIPGNDSSFTSISYYVEQIAEAYAEGKRLYVPPAPKQPVA